MQDFFPFAAFLAAYIISRMSGAGGDTAIYTATAALMLGIVLQIIWIYSRGKKPEQKHWLTCAVILVLGSITLLLHNDLFIKLKPTVLNIAIACVFVFYGLYGKENLVKKMLHSVLEMPDAHWQRLNWCWVGFFLFEAALNAIMAFALKSNDAYVAFKLWGLMALSIIFMVGQMIVLRHYLRQDPQTAAEDKNP